MQLSGAPKQKIGLLQGHGIIAFHGVLPSINATPRSGTRVKILRWLECLIAL